MASATKDKTAEKAKSRFALPKKHTEDSAVGKALCKRMQKNLALRKTRAAKLKASLKGKTQKQKKDLIWASRKQTKVPAWKKEKKQNRVVRRAGGSVRFLHSVQRMKTSTRHHVVHQLKCMLKGDKNPRLQGMIEKCSKNRNCEMKIVKMRKNYQTQLPLRKLPSKDFLPHMRLRKEKLRKTLVPGTVVIIVAGKYKGRKAVFLKQLPKSGNCLVSGPWKLSRVPLRRIGQQFVIATSLSVPLPEGFKVPAHLDDEYFKKVRVVKKKVTEGDNTIFKKEKVPATKKRVAYEKKTQEYIDGKLMEAVNAHEEHGILKKYLKKDFGLLGKRYPHTIKF